MANLQTSLQSSVHEPFASRGPGYMWGLIMRGASCFFCAPWPREEGRRDFEITLILYTASDPKRSLPKRVRKVWVWGMCDRSSGVGSREPWLLPLWFCKGSRWIKWHRQDTSPSSEILAEQVWSVWSGCKQSAGDTLFFYFIFWGGHFKKTFYLEIISNLQKNCKTSTKNFLTIRPDSLMVNL